MCKDGGIDDQYKPTQAASILIFKNCFVSVYCDSNRDNIKTYKSKNLFKYKWDLQAWVYILMDLFTLPNFLNPSLILQIYEDLHKKISLVANFGLFIIFLTRDKPKSEIIEDLVFFSLLCEILKWK